MLMRVRHKFQKKKRTKGFFLPTVDHLGKWWKIPRFLPFKLWILPYFTLTENPIKRIKIRRHVSISQFQIKSSLPNDILKFNRLHNLIFCESGQTCDLLTFAIKSSLQYFAVLLSRSPTTLLCLDLIFLESVFGKRLMVVEKFICYFAIIMMFPPDPSFRLQITF